VLLGDILGDWREEVVWRTLDNSALRIYTTTTPATNRIPTLLQDPQYRLALAWQNVGYNQPPWPSFYLGPGMDPPPPPNIVTKPSAETLLLSLLAHKSGPLDKRVWTVRVINAGPRIAENVEINAVKLTQIHGDACTPVVLPKASAYPPAFPIVIGDADQIGTATGNVTIDFSGCSNTALFSVNMAVSANGGPAIPLIALAEHP
jgi:hypothetical protein